MFTLSRLNPYVLDYSFILKILLYCGQSAKFCPLIFLTIQYITNQNNVLVTVNI